MEKQQEVGPGLVALVLVVIVGGGAATAFGFAAGPFLLEATPEELRAGLVGTGIGITLLAGATGYIVWRIAQSFSLGEDRPCGHGRVARRMFERLH